jgi:hypothetical protein
MAAAGTQGPARRGAGQPTGPVRRPKAKRARPQSKGALTPLAVPKALAKAREPAPRPSPRPGTQGPARRGAGQVRGPVARPKAKPAVHYEKVVPIPSKEQRARQQAVKLAPVISVLEQTTRPLHAVAGAADAALTHKNIARAAARGLQNKDRTTFSTVLKHAGAPKAVQVAGGLGLDIAADPLTYATFGTGTIGRKAVEKAAGTAAGKATRRLARDVNPNIAPEGVPKATWHEATSAARTARATTGRARHEAHQRAVAIRKSIGKNDKVVHDAIESDTIHALPQELQPAARHLKDSYAQIKAGEQAAGIKGGTVSEVKPQPVPVQSADVGGARQAVERATRARYAAERAPVGQRASVVRKARQTLRDAHTALEREKALAATERNTVRRVQKHNALAAVAPKSYVPHYTKASLEARAPSEARGSVGKRVVSPGTSKARLEERQRPLASLRVTHPDTYNEDAALAYVNRMTEGNRAITQAQLNKRLAELGTPVKHGEPVELGPGEQVFHQHGSDLTVVKGKDIERLTKTRERLIVLNEDVVKHAHAISSPGASRSEVARRFDQLQGGFKMVATGTPGFHVRNLIGDTQNAYLAQAGHRIPGNITRAGKTLRALRHSEEAQRTLGATPRALRGSVKVGDTSMTYAELAQEAARVGAIRSGYQNRELHDLLQSEQKGITKVRKGSRVLRSIKRTAQSREDLPRLATYIDARRKGATAEEAARHAAKFHFDYANLSEFERKVARRVVPFYTFSARNIPLQAKMLLKKPGKYAAYQKVREEAANASGQQPGYETNLAPWEQRNAPIPVRIGGKNVTLSAGLPLTDLNEFPNLAHPARLADEYMNKGMSLVTPILKDPVEFMNNYSFFFRGPIRRPTGPLVAAPSFVGAWPQDVKRKLGIARIVDKKTGKKVWGWDAKANYVAHAIPGLPSLGLGLSGGTNQAGRGTSEKIAGGLGLKVTPVDPATAQINEAYKQLDALQLKLAALSQQGVKKATSTPERNRLNQQLRAVERRIYVLAQKRGDKVLPTAGRPRQSSGGGFGSGLGGGLGGSLGGGLGGGL